MSRPSRVCASLGALLVLTATEARAAGPTVDECASANESAQSLRRSGKLREARAQLRVCMAKECPHVVREDCVERIAEVERALPSIVFSAKAPDGADVSEVKVSIDGVPLAGRLDGRALEIDPGPHVFELTTAGYVSVSTRLVVAEGAKGRHELVRFVRPPSPAMTATSPQAPADPAVQPRSTSATRLLAYGLGGLGLVGIGVGTFYGLKTKSTYDHAKRDCSSETTGCKPESVTAGEAAFRYATTSTVAFIAGGALLAGGLVLYFVGSPSSNVRVSASADGAGAVLTRAW